MLFPLYNIREFHKGKRSTFSIFFHKNFNIFLRFLLYKNPDYKEGSFDMCKALDDFYQDGVEQGEDCYRRLILKLSEDHRTELIIQTAYYPELLHKLYKEYNI